MEKVSRKIIRGVPNVSFISLKEHEIFNVKIKRIWTILDEKEMLSTIKFDDMTGEKLNPEIERTLDNPRLIHGYTVFLEDRIHDWEIYGEQLKIFTRIAERDQPIDLLVEYISDSKS